MRWDALGVDYEMAGKDLIDSRQAVRRDLRGRSAATPPEGFNYELFLDEKGQKISKSKGNGLTIDEWLAYGTPESLALFMYNKPREAKRLYFDVIPRAVDDYLAFLDKYPGPGRQAAARQSGLAHPWRHPPAPELVGRRRRAGRRDDLLRDAAQSRRRWRTPRTGRAVGLHPPLRAGRLAGDASAARPRWSATRSRYFRDFVQAGRRRTVCRTRSSAAALRKLGRRARHPRNGGRPRRRGDPGRRSTMSGAADPRYQDLARRRAPRPSGPACRTSWFNTIYQVLLGEERGPRFGSFVALYGVAETIELIENALAGGLVREHEAFLKEQAA